MEQDSTEMGTLCIHCFPWYLSRKIVEERVLNGVVVVQLGVL